MPFKAASITLDEETRGELWDRVQDVCGLYLNLNAPENAIVVSVDEKTAIQAEERVAATAPAEPGRPGRYEPRVPPLRHRQPASALALILRPVGSTNGRVGGIRLGA